MIGGDRESGGEVGSIELIRSPRVDTGELVRDAHATFVPLCEIGPSILLRGKSKRPTKDDGRMKPYLA